MNDLTGQKFGRLLVLEHVGTIGSRAVWKCQCDCGNIKDVTSQHIKDGHARSCGCLRKEKSRIAIIENVHKKHKNFHKEYGLSCKNYTYYHYKKGAKKKNIDFSLTKEQFFDLASNNCYYCGIAPSNIFKRRGMYGEYIYNGIDRVDNNIGYIVDNCVPCCWTCNKSKSNRDYTEFISWLDRIAEYRAREYDLLEKSLTER